jgi:hypothetical protein
VVEGEENEKLLLRCKIYRMTSSKIRQYKFLLKFSVCDDNEPFEGERQQKFDTELSYNLYYNLYAKYFF